MFIYISLGASAEKKVLLYLFNNTCSKINITFSDRKKYLYQEFSLDDRFWTIRLFCVLIDPRFIRKNICQKNTMTLHMFITNTQNFNLNCVKRLLDLPPSNIPGTRIRKISHILRISSYILIHG